MVLAGCGTAGSSSEPDNDQVSTGEFLSEHGLDGMNAVEAIDHLDRLAVTDRPNDLMASVYPAELVLAGEAQEVTIDLPREKAYVSIAPYVDTTHDCFYHSLTTCRGELGNEELDVKITDSASGEVVVDDRATTFDNGFAGFWVPSDIEGTISITHEGKSGSVDFSTGEDGATCITDLRLS
nr:CueP family metal-binding protein [Brevibacterium antiquum]